MSAAKLHFQLSAVDLPFVHLFIKVFKLVKQKGLEFGDWISFQEKDVRGRVIDEYEKIRPAMECRINGEHMQVSLYRDTSV